MNPWLIFAAIIAVPYIGAAIVGLYDLLKWVREL